MPLNPVRVSLHSKIEEDGNWKTDHGCKNYMVPSSLWFKAKKVQTTKVLGL